MTTNLEPGNTCAGNFFQCPTGGCEECGVFDICCENFLTHEGDLMGNDHTHDCENYDGAPVEQWEVTEPRDVYYTDEYYSGTGELIGDDSYIDYLNR